MDEVSKNEKTCGRDLKHSVIINVLPAGAALLHDLSTVVSRQFAESIVTVDNGPVHDLSITQHKICIYYNNYWKEKERHTITC